MNQEAQVIQKIKLEKHSIELHISPNELFTPNAVTRLFSKAVSINPGDIVFDIGSGLCPLTIWAAQEQSKEVHAVEIVQEQYELAGKNVKRYGLENKITLYNGSFFDPIPEGLKANVIIGDVSGIAKNIAKVMKSNDIPWYPPNIPTGGEDGTEVTTKLIELAGNYLLPMGRFYFPISSLSKYKKIENIAKSKFGNLELKITRNFPLEPGQKELIEEVGTSGTYTLRKKGSKDTWTGWIYEASYPIM